MNLIKNIIITILSQIPVIGMYLLFPETLKIIFFFIGGYYILDKVADPIRSYLMELFDVKESVFKPKDKK